MRMLLLRPRCNGTFQEVPPVVIGQGSAMHAVRLDRGPLAIRATQAVCDLIFVVPCLLSRHVALTFVCCCVFTPLAC